MPKPIEVRCDKCGKEFTPDPKAIPTDSGGEYISFACEHCGDVYPVAVITAHGLRLRNRLAHMQERAERNAEHALVYMHLRYQYSREVRKGERP